MPRFVIVRSISDLTLAAGVAAALGRALHLVSAPDAGIHAGALWWQALVAAAGPAAPVATALLDCGDSPGRTMGAIRAGLPDVLFLGPDAVAGPLAQIAEAAGGRLWRQRPAALDLGAVRRPEDACRTWLAAAPDG